MTTMDHKEFYQELGKLLYAIANADGKVQKAELKQLQKIVSDELVPLDDTTDEFGTNAAFITEFMFDVYEGTKQDVEKAFNSFLGYLQINKPMLDEKHKKAVISAAHKVAEAFKGMTDEEKQLIKTLEKEIKR